MSTQLTPQPTSEIISQSHNNIHPNLRLINSDSEEKEHNQYSNITQSEVLSLHEEKLKNNFNNNDNIHNLLNVFGGIDNLLTLLLKSNDIKLNNIQLIKIKEIITKKSAKNMHNNINNNTLLPI